MNCNIIDKDGNRIAELSNNIPRWGEVFIDSHGTRYRVIEVVNQEARRPVVVVEEIK